ncbi:SLATT domain-containing protein [Actinoplanes sp. NPDC048791]|uniref:SLATT domain-containing protein n=1 Tax=Actinoplanes sp. NPDC048791 TaxID=3154623 RepID=UPI0033D289A5
MSDPAWDSAEELMRTWLQRAREGQHSHHEAGKLLKRANYALAVPIIVITAGLGTAAFATIATQLSGGWKVAFGVLGIAAAVLSTLQTHMRYAERAEKHKNLGAQYGVIRRKLETILATPREEREDRRAVLDEVRSKFDALSGEGDVVSRRIFDRTIKRLAERDRQRSKQLGR